MKTFPLFLKTSSRRVFVVGGVTLDEVMEDDGYEAIVEPWLGRFNP